MAEAKLAFLSFETKYLTPKIGPYIKLKLLKSYISYKKKCLKNTKTTAISKNTANFPSKFKVFVFHLKHRIRIHRRATRVGAFEVFEAAHVALRTLLAFSQPVNCIFWPIGMLNWLVAASKLHKHRVTCCTVEWPFYVFLFYA